MTCRWDRKALTLMNQGLRLVFGPGIPGPVRSVNRIFAGWSRKERRTEPGIGDVSGPVLSPEKK
jgi:hypothetical protein